MAKRASEILKIQSIPVGQLLLDPENPRLESITRSKDQPELVKVMWHEMAVSEVALSIAANGFFEEEPLFAIPAPRERGEEERYWVVEGNRRLTAVKLLTDEGLRRLVKATDLPVLSERDREALKTLPVSIYAKRENLWEYFGFRHVNGPKEWDSLSKAAYIARVRREYGKSLDEIAKKIGDQHSTVERIYRGYLLMEQAESMTKFKREDRVKNRFYFSHLYTAASYAEIQKFLGTDPFKSLKENPIRKDHLDNLEELMVWLFGSKEQGRQPVVQTQSPDLGNLKRVIGNPQALSALRSGTISLQRAYAISRGDSRRFDESLASAKDDLQEAKSTVTTGFHGSVELLEQMEMIIVIANSVFDEMRQIAAAKKSK